MHHVVQNNLFSEYGFRKLLSALEDLDLPHTVVEVMPATGEIIPNVALDGPVMVWGSITLGRIATARGWRPGRFYNENFDMRVLHEKYGDHMLNADASYHQFGDIPQFHGTRFLRPVHETKTFSGKVVMWPEIEDWKAKILAASDDSARLKMTTLVMLSSVKTIGLEARFFVIGRRVISGSTYKTLGQTVYQDVRKYPIAKPLLYFAQQMTDIWQPHEAYVMDVAEVDGEQKIVEINCVNSAGFYDIDMRAVVMALEELKYE